MTGKRFISLLLACWLLTAPASTRAAGGGTVAALLSDDIVAYHQVVEYFKTALAMPVAVYNLDGDVERAPAVMAEVAAIKPACILALGAKAALVSKTWTEKKRRPPVLFALVLNWRRYDLLEAANVAGIAAEVAPGTQLANVLMFVPTIKRVGVIYNKDQSETTIEQARNAAEILGIELVEATIERPEEFERSYRKMAADLDAFWMMADPVVYTLRNVVWLKDRCIRDQIVCIGQSVNIARAGLFLAVEPDLASIGTQAANLVKSILINGTPPQEIGVMPPLGTRVVVNLATARAIGLDLEKTALDLATVVIDK